MTRDEFSAALEPALAAITPTLTDGQIAALWSRYREESAQTWRHALESVQQAGRWPTPAGLQRFIDQAKKDQATGPGSSKAKACQCGGRLEVPTDLPAGVTYPLVDLPLESRSPAGRVLHQGENPTAWSWASVRQCSTCRKVYLIAGEDATISDRRGYRRVMRGEIRGNCDALLLEALSARVILGDRSPGLEREEDGSPVNYQPVTHTSGPPEASTSPGAPERP